MAQEEGKRILKEHFFNGKQLPPTRMEFYPEGITKALVFDRYVQKGTDGTPTITFVDFGNIIIRGMFAIEFFVCCVTLQLLF